MKRIVTSFGNSHLFAFLALISVSLMFSKASAQPNIALAAVATHSGGGVSTSGYGPELYNNGVIPPPNTTGTYQWGWVTTNGWIEFTWPSAVNVGKVKVYKQNRPMTTCILQYWNGTAYVNIMTYNNAAAPVVDSMVFTPVNTTKIRLSNVAGSSNPNHGEIEIFGPNIPNDLSVVLISSPLLNSQNCFNEAIPVDAIVKNEGSQPQSNFSVGATYTGPASGNLSGLYAGTLLPQASDTVSLGTLTLQPGSYSIVGYPLLPSDTAKGNDTSAQLPFVVSQPVVVPQAISDTVCLGNSALMYIDPIQNASYNWYSSASGGTLVNVGTSLAFATLLQDTTLYVSTLLNGCSSGRVPITAAIGPPPVVNLGNDTSFCESIPLTLDALNPGGTFTWSTGDSTQIITVTNQSGKYWVEVDKYCITSDTIEVNVSPKAFVSGISFVRMDNTYNFIASNVQNVDNFLWMFGDGDTSTLANPTHTYSHSVNAALLVKLVVSNTCGTDTAFRTVPTSVSGPMVQEDGVLMFPNPARDRLFIKCETSKIKAVHIIGTTGNIVLSEEIQRQSKAELDISRLSIGSYIVRLQTDNGVIHRSLQVVK